jgi:hypothetical protein
VTAPGPEPAAQTPAPGAEPPAKGFRALLAEEFDWAEAMGGPRGMVESVLPGVVFVVVYVIRPALWPAMVAALAVAVATAAVRLFQRGSVMGAVSGLGGIVIGVIWAASTSRAQDYFAFGLWVNAAYLAGTLATMAVRYPLVGAVMALLTGHWGDFRRHKAFMRRAYWLSLMWAGLFGLRLAVELPLYFGAHVALLGSAKLALGLPPTVLALWLSWLGMRPVRLPQLPKAVPEAARSNLDPPPG